MQIIKNTFNSEAHNKALESFKQRLKICGFPTPGNIDKVAIDPHSIAGVLDLFHVQKDEQSNVITGNVLIIAVAIDITTLRVYFKEEEPIELPVGTPTKKGYRSKYRDIERFAVNEQLALCTRALSEMEKFVHSFKVWNPKKPLAKKTPHNHNRKDRVYGYPSDLFGGDSSSYWNID